MAFSPSFSCTAIGALILGCLLFQATNSNAQLLRPDFYSRSCPRIFDIIGNIIVQELGSDPRIAASLLRLHFHDCFVRGCDASILLDNSTSFRTEKDAGPNANSVRGFGVIDRMKLALERACPGIVSCADLLTIASQISVLVSGGPWWPVPLGRRDSTEAFFNLSNSALPSPLSTLAQLREKFADVGLNLTTDLVALSGAHTFGKAQCKFVTARLYDFNGTKEADPSLDPVYVKELRELCPQTGNDTVLVNLDPVSPNSFDGEYFRNLLSGRGLFRSDEALISTPKDDTVPLVQEYSVKTSTFFQAFADAMIRMGNIQPLTGDQGEIRLNCRVVNEKVEAARVIKVKTQDDEAAREIN